jgi:tetratricopeptide (TPR) repeat protein
MADGRANEVLSAALAAVANEATPVADRVEMLIAIATDLQTKPRREQELRNAIELYQQAERLCPDTDRLLLARIAARKATALQALPGDGPESLLGAADALRAAAPVLESDGTAEEFAEVQMNLGLVLQSLVSVSRARITDAISAYHRALRTFSREAHPVEFAILHNNLATAYLSIPLSDERARMREALAVQSFEHALEVVNLVDHPSEYAMLQNNLGNALQYASSSHAVENNLRAIAAYDAALQVRNRRDTPLPYANTIANKANALRNLPDDPQDPESTNHRNLCGAHALYREAEAIFVDSGDAERGRMVAEAAAEIAAELETLGLSLPAAGRQEHEFGTSRVS